MATRDSGTAPITVRTLEDCPEFQEGNPKMRGCKPCRGGASNHCRHPYRPGKSRRQNLKFRMKAA